MATVERFTRSEVLYHDGEGIEDGDLNKMQNLMHEYIWSKAFIDFLFGGEAPAGTRIRPLQDALSVRHLQDMEVEVARGTVFAFVDGERVAARIDSNATFDLDDADDTDPRIDIISAKVEIDDQDDLGADAASRDFEDAQTRELTSQTIDKRRRVKVTMEYTPGTPSSDPDPPGTPDGHDKLVEIKVEANATEVEDSDITDYRVPAGSSMIVVPISSAWTDGNTSVNILNGQVQHDGGGNAVIGIPQVASQAIGSIGSWRHHVRIRTMAVWGKTEGSSQIQFRYSPAGEESGAAEIHTFDLGASFGVDTWGADPPVWLHNGRGNPRITPPANLFLLAELNNSGDKLNAAIIHCYGF